MSTLQTFEFLGRMWVNKIGRELQGLESLSGMEMQAAWEQNSGEEKLGR